MQVEAALANPQSGLIVADRVQFDGPRIIRDSLIGAPVQRLMDPAAATTTLWGQGHFMNGNFVSTASQVMIPREVLRLIGPSDTSLALASDWDLYLRISLCYPITLIRQPLMSWRYLATSASGPDTLRALRWGEEDLKLLQKHLHLASPEMRPLIRRSLGSKAFATAQAAYYYGLDAERAPALAVQRRLLLKRHASVVAVSFWLALDAPRALTALLGPKVRVLLGSRSRTRGSCPWPVAALQASVEAPVSQGMLPLAGMTIPPGPFPLMPRRLLRHRFPLLRGLRVFKNRLRGIRTLSPTPDILGSPLNPDASWPPSFVERWWASAMAGA